MPKLYLRKSSLCFYVGICLVILCLRSYPINAPRVQTQLNVLRQKEFYQIKRLFKDQPSTQCRIDPSKLTPVSNCPSVPFCSTRHLLLDSFADGKRLGGFGHAFCPSSCRARWLSQNEICSVLSKYEQVVLMGDSLVRQVHQSIVMLLRNDIYLGSMRQWEFKDTEAQRACSCEQGFSNPDCREKIIREPYQELQHLDLSTICHAPYSLHLNDLLQLHTATDQIWSWQTESLKKPASRKTAVIAGTGIWDNFDGANATAVNREVMKYLHLQVAPENQEFKMSRQQLERIRVDYDVLWMLPPAAAINKPVEWQESQGNPVILAFYDSMIEHLKAQGTPAFRRFNHTELAPSYDGTHFGYVPNLEQAMVLLNWLDLNS